MVKEKTTYNFENGKVYEGFKCIKCEELEDIKSTGYVFEHEKTKARLVYMKNDDKNKVFSIGFRTPPSNSKGIPHIIEHSVLCGSKNYPVKEPFTELMKGSVKTFLNAMTGTDRTYYPVASTNEKDYMNLMGVYLDAVFYPSIYIKEEIFMQEGWHYELLDKNEPLTIKGVVYNEMKGAYSNPMRILSKESMKALMPNTCYVYESGGYPDEIPDLTYEEFLDFHKKYYHPSNSYIYLYGDLNPISCLKEINDKYLKDFEYKEIDSKIKLQEKFKEPAEVVKNYAISNNSADISKKSMMSMCFLLERKEDMELLFAFEMLGEYLFGSSASPLKKVILEKDLCSNANGYLINPCAQPMFQINFTEMKKEDKEEIKKTVLDELKKISSNGIDTELMEGAINKIEFNYREITDNKPMGLTYNTIMFQKWLYDDDPFEPLRIENNIKIIREKFKNGYFEKLIEDSLINNTHMSVVLLNPDKTLKEKEENKLKEKLADVKAKMTDKELEEMIEKTKSLMEWQVGTDTKEDLKCIPILKLGDLSKEAEKIKIDKTEIDGVKVYKSESRTNKIAYLDFSFDTSAASQEDIPYVKLLAKILLEVGTTNMSHADLIRKIGLAAGRMNFGIEVLEDADDSDKYTPFLKCQLAMLEEKRDDMIKIALEIINNTKFDEEAKIKKVISKLRIYSEQAFINAGAQAAMRRIKSYYSESGRYLDMTCGIDFYDFICDLDSNFEDRKAEVKGKLEKLMKLIFKKENLHMTVVCEEGIFDKTTDEVKEFISGLDTSTGGEVLRNKYSLNKTVLNEGIQNQSGVQYVALGGNFKKLGYDYTGKMQVLCQILRYDYLWNTIRLKGGAYGCRINMNTNGDFVVASHRDPNLEETYENFENMDKYLEGFDDKNELDKYIIGTIGKMDYPYGPYTKAKIAEERDIQGITHEDIQKERDEIFSTTYEDIRSYAKLVRDIVNENMICTIGNERKIKESEKIFKTLKLLK